MRFTLYGMYSYDETLFERIEVPTQVEKNILINRILSRSGDLYPFYQNLPQLKENIFFWFKSKRHDFQMMADALSAEYNPLENYDRHEDNTRSGKNSGTDVTTTSNEVNTKDKTHGDTHSDSVGNNGSSTTNSVSAYNQSDIFSDRDMTRSSSNDASILNEHTSGEASGESKAKGSNAFQHGHVLDEHELIHAHGNIGTTKNQEMVSDEVRLRATLGLYDTIAELFEKEFCVQVY